MLSISLRGLLALGVLQLPNFKAFILVSELQVHWGKLGIWWRIDFFPENTGLGMMVATSCFHWLPFFLTEALLGDSSTEVGETLHGGSPIHFHLIWKCWTFFMVFFLEVFIFLNAFACFQSECLFRVLIGLSETEGPCMGMQILWENNVKTL